MILDYDPLTGVRIDLDFVEEGNSTKVVMTHKQNVQSILESSKMLANSDDYTRKGVKQDQWHYARLPYVIMQEMKAKYHADWNDKNDKDHKRFFSVLNTHYPAFKTTHWNHE